MIQWIVRKMGMAQSGGMKEKKSKTNLTNKYRHERLKATQQGGSASREDSTHDEQRSVQQPSNIVAGCALPSQSQRTSNQNLRRSSGSLMSLETRQISKNSSDIPTVPVM